MARPASAWVFLGWLMDAEAEASRFFDAGVLMLSYVGSGIAAASRLFVSQIQISANITDMALALTRTSVYSLL